MAQPTQGSGGGLVGWYERRIGEPVNDDEAYGYWLFALGVLAGIVGLVMYFTAEGNLVRSTTKMIGVTLAGIGLILLIAGPIIRLPLKRPATLLTYLGLAVSLAGLAWFLFAYPVNPLTEAGQATAIISVYAAGLGVMAIGGILVPLLTEPSEERHAQAARIADLESNLEAERDRADRLEGERDESEEELADREAEVDALAARIEATEASQARFELYEDKAGKWRFRLRHRNGNVIADSGQGYASKQKAQQGMHSVRRNALGAGILQIASEDEAAAPDLEPESRAEFELYEDDAGEWRWRLVHENGNVIADSGQGYASKQKARQGMDSVKRNVRQADYLRIDPTAYEVYRDRAGRWRWRLVHENGNVLADGGQGYSSRQAARKGVDSVRNNAADADLEVEE